MIRKKDILFVDLDLNFKVTKNMKSKAINNPDLTVRQRLGLFRTEEEQEKYVTKSLKRRMP